MMYSVTFRQDTDKYSIQGDEISHRFISDKLGVSLEDWTVMHTMLCRANAKLTDLGMDHCAGQFIFRVEYNTFYKSTHNIVRQDMRWDWMEYFKAELKQAWLKCRDMEFERKMKGI